MPRRRNDIEALQGFRGLSPHVTGHSTTLFEAIVISVNTTHKVLDAQPVSRRGATVACRYPRWYEPALGDHVVIGELQGDENLRIVLVPIETKTGGAPKVT